MKGYERRRIGRGEKRAGDMKKKVFLGERWKLEGNLLRCGAVEGGRIGENIKKKVKRSVCSLVGEKSEQEECEKKKQCMWNVAGREVLTWMEWREMRRVEESTMRKCVRERSEKDERYKKRACKNLCSTNSSTRLLDDSRGSLT